MQRLRVLVRKEFQELRMNPRLFGLVVIAPILQLTRALFHHPTGG